MATEQIIAARTQLAVERLTKAQDALQGELNIEFTPGTVTNKDKGVARYQQLENIAGFIETVTKAVKAKKAEPKGKPDEPVDTPTLTAPSTPPVVTQQPKPPTATLSPPEPKKPGRPPHKAK